jgi:hypothetical protein
MKEQGLFSTKFKQQLREHSWDELQKSDTNPAQYWRRKKENTIEALKDISFFLNKLPSSKRTEILNYETLFPLVKLTLKEYENDDNKKEVMHFMLETLDKCLYHLTNIYSSKNEESPNISSLTVEHLERTRGICRDISNIVINERAELEGHEQGLTFLFKTVGRSIYDRIRFEKFIRQLLTKNKEVYATGLVHDSNVNDLNVTYHIVLFKNPNYYEFKAYLHDPFEAEHYGDIGETIGEIVIKMDPVNNKACMHISIADVKIIKNLEVIDKEYIKYFYLSKNYSKKRIKLC